MTEMRPHLKRRRKNPEIEAFYDMLGMLKEENDPYVVLRGAARDMTDEIFEAAGQFDLEVIEFDLVSRDELVIVASSLVSDDEETLQAKVLDYIQKHKLPFHADLSSPTRH